MKKHLNTLYVTTQGAYLSVEGDSLIARVDHAVRTRVPLHMLESLVCFGRVSVSPFLLRKCSDFNIGVSFLTERGRFMARVQGPTSGNVLLRRTQYRKADDPDFCAAFARTVVTAKVVGARSVLQRMQRDHASALNDSGVPEAIRTLANSIAALTEPQPLDSVRGIEGDASRIYFSVFDHLILESKGSFAFRVRSRRPPMDRVNALLSFVYTLLAHDVASALESVGLDPQVGYLHRDRPGRPGLALDMMEEYRAYLADRLVLSLINRRQVRESGFDVTESGGVLMDEEARKTVLVAYQERKSDLIRHPYLGEQTTVGMLFHLQARLLARFLRGDLDGYPPFLSK